MRNTPLTVAELQALLDGVPFVAHLGIVVIDSGSDGVRIEATLPPSSLGNPEIGAVHGGVVASMIDIVASSAVCARLGQSGVITVDMRVDFHRPAFGDRFVLLGRTINQGRTLMVSEGEVHNPDGKLIASGRMLATLIKPM
jgi:uncharacterized protein (TIGR00369 family)